MFTRSLKNRLLQLQQVMPSHPLSLAIVAAIFNSFWFHGPLGRYLAQQLDFTSVFGWATAAAVWLLPTTLSVILFTSVALFSNLLLKICIVIVFLGNAIALYFIDQYQVLLDKTMMGNVFSTDSVEVSTLMHPMLILYLVFWGGLPALLVWFSPLRSAPWGQKILGWLFAPSICLFLVYSLSFTWLWIDQHASRVGAQLLPWSYLINTARHLDQERHNRLEFKPLMESVALPLGERKRVVVLVIGESARADRHSMLGYERDTNASTRPLGAVSFSGVQACASYTVAALNCILSHIGDEAPERSTMGEPLPNYLNRQGVDVIWRTANNGHPPIKARLFETLSAINLYCPGGKCENDKWDESLLNGLKDLIEQSTQRRIFVVLHLQGSHGPAYHTKYPPEFERFKPTCTTVVLKDCNAQALQNAYDNTIAYTDHVLAKLTRILQSVDATTGWLYVADHGESLGESGLYLHGTPRVLAPSEQINIPLMIWLSPAFRQEVHIDTSKAAGLIGIGQGHVFHTVMGMLAMNGGPYRPKLDILKELE